MFVLLPTQAVVSRQNAHLVNRPDTGYFRSRRVILLLLGVVVLSIADLVITLTHLKTFGMLESNPIAVYLVQTTESPFALISFKLLTVLVCVGLLYNARRSLPGEVGAWLAVAILSYMSVLWYSYTRYMSSPVEVNLVRSGSMTEEWLMLPGATQLPPPPPIRLQANAPS